MRVASRIAMQYLHVENDAADGDCLRAYLLQDLHTKTRRFERELSP